MMSTPDTTTMMATRTASQRCADAGVVRGWDKLPRKGVYGPIVLALPADDAGPPEAPHTAQDA